MALASETSRRTDSPITLSFQSFRRASGHVNKQSNIDWGGLQGVILHRRHARGRGGRGRRRSSNPMNSGKQRSGSTCGSCSGANPSVRNKHRRQNSGLGSAGQGKRRSLAKYPQCTSCQCFEPGFAGNAFMFCMMLYRAAKALHRRNRRCMYGTINSTQASDGEH